MSSQALRQWLTSQRIELDRFETVLRAVRPCGGPVRQQLVDAYLLLVAAHFQLYCRRLHDEPAPSVVAQTGPPPLSEIVRESLVRGRRLDRDNAQPDSVASDFDRLGMGFSRQLTALDARNQDRMRRLRQLNVWRNAIAHQDFLLTPGQAATVAGTRRSLKHVRIWRSNCSTLARQFDAVVGRHIASLSGTIS